MSETRVGVAIAAVSLGVVLVVGLLFLRAAPRPGTGRWVSALPSVNAFLNGTSAVLLVGGYLAIRRRRVAVHRACMVGAFAVSSLFLISYVTYHAQAAAVPFPGQGALRAGYLALLASHIVLAAAIVPLALLTLYRAWRGAFARHRRIARWTLPVWLYVSLTGVVIYWMLYHLAAAGRP